MTANPSDKEPPESHNIAGFFDSENLSFCSTESHEPQNMIAFYDSEDEMYHDKDSDDDTNTDTPSCYLIP